MAFRGVAYGYMVDGSQNPLADIVTTVDFDDASATLLRMTRQHELNRNLIDAITNVWDPDGTPATISSYVYANDVRGRRTSVINEGDDVAFDDDEYTRWGYNSRSELTESHRFEGDDPDDYATNRKVEAEYLDFNYDPIGNRTSHSVGSSIPVFAGYTSNAVNQYRTITSPLPELAPLLFYDDDGNLTGTADMIPADMILDTASPRQAQACDGVVDFGDIDPFVLALSGQAAYEAVYPDCVWLHGDLNGDDDVDFDDYDLFVSEIGENSVQRVFTWDAENRLTSVGPHSGNTETNDVKVEFAYDYLGRRVSKTVSTYTGSAWQVSQKLKFVWHGWLMLVELEEDAQQDDDVMRKYTWGLDLVGQSGATGSLEGAGGILDTTSPRQAQVGGLLAVEEPQTVGDPLKYVYTYDANGNVGQVVDLTAASAATSIKVKYEYGPYGSRVNTPAQDEYEQPFRFSTKQWDDETGLGYWGYRYYSPVLGRWISRDPIEERGGRHLYAYARNAVPNIVDAHGLWGDGRRASKKIKRLRDIVRRRRARVRRLCANNPSGNAHWDCLNSKKALKRAERRLAEALEATSPGHSDFPGYEDFDWTREDRDFSPLNPEHAWRHFRPMGLVQIDVDRAIAQCNKSDFESFMHQGQDYFSHWMQGHRWNPIRCQFGHLLNELPFICDGDDPDDARAHPKLFELAREWTQRQLDKWNKHCCKNANGEWGHCCP